VKSQFKPSKPPLTHSSASSFAQYSFQKKESSEQVSMPSDEKPFPMMPPNFKSEDIKMKRCSLGFTVDSDSKTLPQWHRGLVELAKDD